MKPYFSQTGVKLFHADCLEAMRQMEECSISACVTDPPYGLGEVKNLPGLLEAWMTDECDKKHIGKSGFMSREWDAGVPSPRYWKEVFRVMKPGAHLLCFASTRTWDLMSLSIRLAGFENRDTIRHHQGVPSLAWITGSGFPKGHDISKAIDRLAGNARQTTGLRRPEQRVAYGEGAGALRCIECGNSRNGTSCKCELPAPRAEEAKKWAGWNTALKPAWEVILVFRRPLEESSIARNVLEHGTGAINIAATRVGSGGQLQWAEPRDMGYHGGTDNGKVEATKSTSGRFSANLLLSHVSGPTGCQRIGTKRVKPGNGSGKVGKGRKASTINTYGQYGPRPEVVGFTHLDPDGTEEIESWECARDEGGHYICPVALLDLQSGQLKGGGFPARRNSDKFRNTYSRYQGQTDLEEKRMEGGWASRFFQQFHGIDTGPGFFYSPKSSRRERNAGLEDMPDVDTRGNYGDGIQDNRPHTREGYEYRAQTKNNHPTVKPLALMRYLVRLVTPPNGTVLDCFAGSGTTGIAGIQEGFNFIGIEAEEEYCQMAAARIAHAGKEESPKPRPLKIVPKPAESHIEAQASLFGEGVV